MKREKERIVRRSSPVTVFLAHLALFHLVLDFGVFAGHVVIYPVPVTFAKAEQSVRVSPTESWWDRLWE